MLAPSSIQEIADLTQTAFDLADQYRIVVMILGDGILGQMMEPVELKATPPQNPVAKPWALTGAHGREQNIIRTLLLDPSVLEDLNHTLQATYQEIENHEVRCEQYEIADADIILVAYGVVARVVRAAVNKARQQGIRAGWIRPITLWPFPKEIIRQAADEPRVFLVVEMSHGQMLDDVQLSVGGCCPVMFYGRAGGTVPTVEEVLEYIEKLALPVKG